MILSLTLPSDFFISNKRTSSTLFKTEKKSNSNVTEKRTKRTKTNTVTNNWITGEPGTLSVVKGQPKIIKSICSIFPPFCDGLQWFQTSSPGKPVKAFMNAKSKNK